MSDLFINVLLIIGLTNISIEKTKVNSNHSHLCCSISYVRGKNIELFLIFWYNTNTQQIGDNTMVSFLKYAFTIKPEFVSELTDSFKEFDWLQEFISVEPCGKVTLFDIQDGQTEDAITQVMGSLSPEGVASIHCDIIACEMNEVVRCRVKDGQVVKQYACDFVWSATPA
jgi:hypothetical protein